MSDLTKEEQTNVRTALKFLHARCGTWANVTKALRLGKNTPGNVAGGFKAATPMMAFRIARLAGVGVDDVLTGRFPVPGTCPHCGYLAADRL